MAGSLFTTEYFSCPSCGLTYSATREQLPAKHSGSFACQVCEAKVHVWSGNFDLFEWKIDQPEAREFGKRWAGSTGGPTSSRG
jgi:hypothetical protein